MYLNSQSFYTAAHRIASGANPRERPESHEERRHVLLSQSGVATPALFRFMDTCRRSNVGRTNVPATFYIPDNGGCSQATAWMLRLIESSPESRAFPPFFLSSSKGDRCRVAEDIGRATRCPPETSGGKKNLPFPPCPRPPSCRNNRYTHTVAPTHMHTRVIARAFANAPRFRYVLLLAVGPI